MGYRTVNEAEHFEFQDAQIIEVFMDRGHLIMDLGYVTILPENTCNRDIRKMGTNELRLQIQQAQILQLVEEGYKIYDADGKLTGTCDDRVLPQEEYVQMLADWKEGTIYSLEKKAVVEKKGFEYTIYVDANERTYCLVVEGTRDIQEWEKFMNREASY